MVHDNDYKIDKLIHDSNNDFRIFAISRNLY
ncbi:hypothetical protein BC670_2847 [Flavobacterium branchiophilum]|uniref:Uncharacterized protein n=1 Tax=Flavobacterium branchiophilum TaxID=55197 RepID=A0A543G6W9_9FLAO|nr:hypothetical protein BC670_2847 [Flavobacterium branchiophilum]